MCFAVESINGTDTGYFKFVGNSAYINIAGWVTDALKNSTSGAVIAVLNGQTYSSRIRTERPDLANKLNKPALTHPGWVITIPCSELTNGKQELTFKVVNETETGYYQPKDKLVFYNITSATSENYNKLILSSEKTEFFIDAINGIQPNLVSGAIQIKTNVLFISGWAVDHPAKKLADGVLVVIDGKHFTAHYGTNRPDVAEQYKNPAYKQSGWVIEIPVSVLGAGVHQLTLKIISNNKLSYFNIENQITIKTN
jgi:hypothetical protein